MKFVETVGDYDVCTEENGNGITVALRKGGGELLRKTYHTGDEKAAIEKTFRVMDIFTLDWLEGRAGMIEKVEQDLYRCEHELFRQIDNTRFFRHQIRKV